MANGNDEWWQRLTREVEAARERGRSYREISLAAGLGENYVEQLVKKDAKSPRAEIVLRLCRVLGLSPAYIFTGVRMTPEAEELLARWQNIPTGAKDGILQMMKAMPMTPPNDGPPQEQPVDPQ